MYKYAKCKYLCNRQSFVLTQKKEHLNGCSLKNLIYLLLPSLSFFSIMPASSEKVRMKSSAKKGFAKSEKNPVKNSPKDSKNPFAGFPETVLDFKIGLHFAITFSPYKTIIPHFKARVKVLFFAVFLEKIAFFGNKCVFCFKYFVFCVKLIWNILWSDLWQKRNTNRKT